MSSTLVSEFDLGWLAGTIDSEGCIFLGRYRRKDSRRPGLEFWQYAPHVRISNTNMVFIQNCLRILGFGDKHNYTHNYQTGNNRKPVHHVVIYSQIEAQRVLEFIGPRLVIKKRQADLLLEWLAIKKPRTHDSHPSIVRPREEEIYWELRTLNHRGNQLVGVMPEQEAIATK